MSSNGTDTAPRHDALLYDGEEEFLAGALPFLHEGLAADDHVLVVLDDAKIALLRSELAGDAADVQFADMREVGSNPARLIPAWHQYIEARSASGRNVRGLGEPVWAGRSDAELAECRRHEMLLNLAFAEVEGISLLCPYDSAALGDDVVAAAHRSHPVIVECGARRQSDSYCGSEAAAGLFDEPLPDPRAPVRDIPFGSCDLAALRHFIAGRARAAGLDALRCEDIVLAVNEIATNSIRHGGGSGTLRVWQESGSLICEVRDAGRFVDPLAGRRRPSSTDLGGRGLWLANQVCDLVQLRSYAHGCAVRLHMRTR